MKLNENLLNKAILIAIIGVILTSTGILFYFLALRLGGIAKENQTYNRYISCVLSVPPDDRNQEKIDMCWNAAQNDTGIHVKRYDK